MRHPESPRFAGALAGLGVIALAALVAVVLLVAFGPPPKTTGASVVPKSVSVTELDNAQLLEQLGEPAGAIDCEQALQLQQQMTGFVWVDQANGRLVVVCAP